ncbi:ferrochelatase [Subtercola boreus]|uniref:Coproporphyrin III ferrochelatase n=1 Tax=Subtercola boreus TaxID=120213 RepID=A0A3E0WG59_9MICO|nr:ferrochelatase [Subtercola boreus]RFA24092.1 ferrochelatase [Subtercola boreus]RFA29573.1 ferrochelatase [Subtercola boreus]
MPVAPATDAAPAADPNAFPEGVLVRAATPAAASGAEHVEEAVAYDAILLASFGGPEGQDDVIPFLRNVTRGRGIPDERLEEVAHHYRAFGGISPINEQNRELKAALEAELARRGIDLPVLWGNRNWAPYLPEALREANERGFTKLIAIGTSAYSSYSSCRQYREDYAKALTETGLEGTLQIDKVRQFFDHPGFVAPFIDGVAAAFDQIEAALPGIDLGSEVEVLFSTHSIPSTDADRSGPPERGFGPGGAYQAQHRAVAEVVMEAVGVGRSSMPQWQLVFQSRSGPPTQPWLEPDVNDAIGELPARGIRAVVIVPLGFVSDHMEVKWDLDKEATDTANENALYSVRVPTPGVHQKYVSGLIDLVLERVNGVKTADRPSLTELGPWYDVCRTGCCENVRLGFRPALAGLAP